MAPYDLPVVLGQLGANSVYLLLGIAFGYILEASGFGDSRKLAGQFFFRDLAVLQVMFTAIITCMVLVFWATALGWLDYEALWVNPTYLGPDIVGGLLMGVGFIIGGFCPGTSLVSVATLKLDGIFFAGGVLLGILVFGETVPSFTRFYTSSFYGRLTLQDWLGLETGTVVVLAVCMALFMFWGGGRIRALVVGKERP